MIENFREYNKINYDVFHMKSKLIHLETFE